ncbi:cytochrome P450 87A3-like isoform X1 [Papaver somniferum]|nr:cytochrome P450 87A3-like isoform X1 [Papaver somniferum]
MLSEFVKGLMSIPLNIPGTTYHRCMKNQKKVLQLMKDILREGQNSTEKRKGDFLDQLIDDVKKEEFMSVDLAAVIMIALVFASFETVSTAFRVAMMFLTDQQAPLIVKELLVEHQTIIHNRENVDSPLTWEEYKSMTFTPKVINETLRMTNSLPGIVRKANKDVHINGYVIPRGWIIIVIQTAMHMNPEKFKDPLSFNPWRWNDIGSNIMGKSFIPYGGGKRNCAGTEFFKVLMSVFLHVLVTKYSWIKVKGGQAVRWPGLSVKDGFHV